MADIVPAPEKKPRKKRPKKKTTTGKTPPPQSLTPPAPSTGAPPPAEGAASTGSPPGIDPAVLQGVVTLPFAIWARIADNDDLLLKQAETGALAGALAGVCDKYLPKAAGAAGPEIALIMCLGMVIGPRMTLPTKPPTKPKQETNNGAALDHVRANKDADKWTAPPDSAAGGPGEEPGWIAPPDNAAARQ